MKNDITQLYEQYSDKIYRICKGILKNEDDAADIVQETFICAAQKLHTVKNADKTDKWLCSVAANKCKDYMRKNKPVSVEDVEKIGNKGESSTENIEQNTPEKAVLRNFVREDVNKIVQSLPVMQKTVVVGFYYNQMSVRELAKYCKCSESAVKTALHRARKSVKTECERQNVQLSGYSVSALLALSGIGGSMPAGFAIAATSAAGAITVKIIAGVCAAAMLGYGGYALAQYGGRDDAQRVAITVQTAESTYENAVATSTAAYTNRLTTLRAETTAKPTTSKIKTFDKMLFVSTSSASENKVYMPVNLSIIDSKYDYNLYYYHIDNVEILHNGKKYNLSKVLTDKIITIDEILAAGEKMQKQKLLLKTEVLLHMNLMDMPLLNLIQLIK